MTENDNTGLWRPDDTIIVYPMDVLLNMFGHAHPGSVRKAMSRSGYKMVRGYSAFEAQEVLSNLSEVTWSRRPGARNQNRRN